PLQLPLDHERPQLQSSDGDLLFGALDKDLLKAIDKKAREEQVSTFMYLTTAVNILLARFSGQETILLGLPVANRESNEVADTIGYFANTLVLKTDVDLRKSFKETLQQVRQTSLEAFKHQDTSFEEIVNALSIERDRSRTPVFQALLSYEENSGRSLSFGSVAMKRLEVSSSVSRTDLSIWISRENEVIRLGFEYATRLFKPESIRRLMDAFVAILEASVMDLESPIFKLPLMADAAKKRVLVEWNETDTSYPAERPFYQLFEDTAACLPDKTAVVFADTERTYHELNTAANQLAHLLIANGIQPGQRIGLYMSRSVEMLISLLAIQKAGATYVPMDPDFPEDRLLYMLSDAGISLLLTEEKLRANLQEYSGKRICYEEYMSTQQQLSDKNPNTPFDPSAPMYIIYTSGSTGLPKGVVLPNRAVTNFLYAMRDKPGLIESDRLLAITTLSFDIAVLELYLPLLTGATVVIAPREAVLDSGMLQEMLQEHRISMMQATPAS
ncbi:MAG: AMP-binding protein, partial [Calditrichota bacterium]